MTHVAPGCAAAAVRIIQLERLISCVRGKIKETHYKTVGKLINCSTVIVKSVYTIRFYYDPAASLVTWAVQWKSDK